MPSYVFDVQPEYNELRLDVFLVQALPDVPSRTFVKKIIDAGYAQVNQMVIKAHGKVHVHDTITVNVPDEWVLKPQDIKPQNIPLDIFYEDEDLIVINKPKGMLVHPAHGCDTGTLANALLYHCQKLSSLNTESRPGIVHRLDQETSGLMIAAKNNWTHAKLARQFKDHLVRKKYVALVDGEIEFDEGKIDVSLGRHIYHREKMDVQFDEAAKEAVTFYRVIQRYRGITFVSLFPRTGRTHQLRVHMKYLKHPILGDNKYGKAQTFPRLALHAQAIGFIHPRLNSYLEFSSKTPIEFLEAVGL